LRGGEPARHHPFLEGGFLGGANARRPRVVKIAVLSLLFGFSPGGAETTDGRGGFDTSVHPPGGRNARGDRGRPGGAALSTLASSGRKLLARPGTPEAWTEFFFRLGLEKSRRRGKGTKNWRRTAVEDGREAWLRGGSSQGRKNRMGKGGFLSGGAKKRVIFCFFFFQLVALPAGLAGLRFSGPRRRPPTRSIVWRGEEPFSRPIGCGGRGDGPLVARAGRTFAVSEKKTLKSPPAGPLAKVVTEVS